MKHAKMELIGKQKNLDRNKNGKIDSEDLRMIRENRMMADGGGVDDMPTKEEILDQITAFEVDIWSNPNRPDSTIQADECEYCGRVVGENPLHVHISTSGIVMPTGISAEDLEKVGEESQGCFPIGNGCAKKLFGNKIEQYTFRYKPENRFKRLEDGGVVPKKGSEWAFWAGLLGLGVLGYFGINKK